jgi:excisionase family DNA binding protein
MRRKTMKEKKMNTHLLKAKEVAERLNISRSQAFALMRNGNVPIVKFGKLVRVRPEDLEEFIEMNLTNHDVNPLKATLAAATVRVETLGKSPVIGDLTHEKV